MNRVVIGAGSNVHPWDQIARARKEIERTFRLIKSSRLRETETIGPKDQPNFINRVFLIETDLSPEELKVRLREIEKKLGRVRGANQNGPWELDLDILLWNGEVVDPDLHKLEFLKEGVREVWPDDD